MSFFKNPQVLKIRSGFFFEKEMTVFGGKLVKNAPNLAFFGALRANRSTFGSFTAKMLKRK